MWLAILPYRSYIPHVFRIKKTLLLQGVCVWNICTDVKLRFCGLFCFTTLPAGGPGPSFPTWSNEAGIWRGMHWGTLRCVPASGRSWAIVWQLGVPGTLLGPLMTAGGPASFIFISPRSSISPTLICLACLSRRWFCISPNIMVFGIILELPFSWCLFGNPSPKQFFGISTLRILVYSPFDNIGYPTSVSRCTSWGSLIHLMI